MTLDMACEGCGQKYRLPAALAGKKAKCKACGILMTIPSTSLPLASPSPPPAPAKPVLQSFGTPPPPRAKPAIQSFGTPRSSATPRKPAPPASRPVDEPLDDFEEVDDADDPYGFDDRVAAVAKPYSSDEEEDDELPAATRRPGRAIENKKKKVRRMTNTAGFGKRFSALFIDGCVLLPFSLYVLVQVKPAPLGEGDLSRLLDVRNVYYAVGVGLYYLGMEASPLHATLGKLAMGLRVVDTDGRPASPMRAAARVGLRAVSGLFGIPSLISAFTVASSGRNQALHDMFSGTMVVHKD
ncbi:MAG: hypothetical protein JWN86_607 [Planctomycetota bacterium]|nr:hypothetical protein [Planctomycetota bacterium]